MSVSDSLMWRYYDLLSFRGASEIARFKLGIDEGRNPHDIKVLLAQELVGRFHSRLAAEEALAEFEARFRQGACLKTCRSWLSKAKVLQCRWLMS